MTQRTPVSLLAQTGMYSRVHASGRVFGHDFDAGWGVDPSVGGLSGLSLQPNTPTLLQPIALWASNMQLEDKSPRTRNGTNCILRPACIDLSRAGMEISSPACYQDPRFLLTDVLFEERLHFATARLFAI